MDNPNAFAATMREADAAMIPDADYAEMRILAGRYLARGDNADLADMLGLDATPPTNVVALQPGARRSHTRHMPHAHRIGALQ